MRLFINIYIIDLDNCYIIPKSRNISIIADMKKNSGYRPTFPYPPTRFLRLK